MPENLVDSRENYRTTEADLVGHIRKVNITKFNPLAENILFTSSLDNTLRVWDVSRGTCALTLNLPDTLQSLCFNYNTSLAAGTFVDRSVRLLDPRANTVVGDTEAHTGVKPSRITWLGSRVRPLIHRRRCAATTTAILIALFQSTGDLLDDWLHQDQHARTHHLGLAKPLGCCHARRCRSRIGRLQPHVRRGHQRLVLERQGAPVSVFECVRARVCARWR